MRTHPSTHICTFSLFGCACTTQLLPPLSCVQARWRQLRSCAGALESITWAYRTRVAPFKPDALRPNADDDKAEQVLRMALVEWRQGLSAGADLNNTTLGKSFPEWVFKHDQREPKAGEPKEEPQEEPKEEPKADSWWQRWANKCCVTKSCGTSAAAVDDYFSPIMASEYIQLRLRPAIDFYQKRVPEKTHQRLTLKLLLLIATVASSFLARYKCSYMVTIVTAFASMIISYSEFADADRKVER